MNELPGTKKALGGADVFLGLVCAILFADLITSNTQMGPSVIIWWLIAAVIIFIPNGLVTAELASTYPDKGGLYAWVRRAFGPAWGARLSWFYWINIALWVPSAYTWFSGAFLQVFFPEAGYWMEVLIGVALVWLTVWLCTKKLADSKWVINIAGLCKILIFVLVMAAGIAFLANGNRMANVVSAETMTPTLDGGLMYLPVIIYLCCGMEILSANSQEMRNPKKDMSRAVIGLVVICVVFNILASWGMLATVPAGGIDLLTGIHTVMVTAFGNKILAGAVMLILLFSVFAQIMVWMLGGAVGAMEAGQDGELPGIYGKESKKTEAPIGALTMTGIVSSAAIILYGFMAETASDLFFTLLAFSSIVYFFPYLIMFPAFIRLRKTDGTPRAFRAPAGRFLAVLCEIVLVFAVILFIWLPDDSLGFHWENSLPIIVGVAATVVLGEIIVRHMLKKNNLL
jgi:amino acid transporter